MGKPGDPGRILGTWFGGRARESVRERASASERERGRHDGYIKYTCSGNIAELRNLLYVRDKKEKT